MEGDACLPGQGYHWLLHGLPLLHGGAAGILLDEGDDARAGGAGVLLDVGDVAGGGGGCGVVAILVGLCWAVRLKLETNKGRR